MTVDRRQQSYLHHHVDRPTVTWILTDYCNFDCTYCYAKQIGELRRPPPPPFSTDEILAGFRRELPDWIVDFLGGEPFLFGGFVDMAVRLTSSHLIGMYTNLSLTRQALEFARKVDPSRVLFIDCALHPETRELRDPGFRTFIQTIRTFQSAGFNIGVSAVLSPMTAPRMERDLLALEDEGIRAFIKPFFGASGGRSYPYVLEQDQAALARRFSPGSAKQSPHAGALRLSRGSFRGTLCSSGVNYLEIESRGDAWRCTTDRHYSRECLGNVFAGSFRRPSRPVACQSAMCLCSAQGLGYSLGPPMPLDTTRPLPGVGGVPPRSSAE
jgi:MoaA/NifB/PqqE/SkfB family radical SAM enzyme